MTDSSGARWFCRSAGRPAGWPQPAEEPPARPCFCYDIPPAPFRRAGQVAGKQMASCRWPPPPPARPRPMSAEISDQDKRQDAARETPAAFRGAGHKAAQCQWLGPHGFPAGRSANIIHPSRRPFVLDPLPGPNFRRSSGTGQGRPNLTGRPPFSRQLASGNYSRPPEGVNSGLGGGHLRKIAAVGGLFALAGPLFGHCCCPSLGAH